MNREEIIALMKSSLSETEWKNNCDKVKRECGGYPEYWYEAIIWSGLLYEVSENWKQTIP